MTVVHTGVPDWPRYTQRAEIVIARSFVPRIPFELASRQEPAKFARVKAAIAETGVRVVTGFNRARRNVLHHRNVSGEYRDANDHTARLAATYGASTELVGLLGQAALLLIGGNMVRDNAR